MKAAAFSLVVLTLNVAGPRRIHQGWPTRRESIVARLKTANIDAAAFQEVWRGEDLDALENAAGHGHAAADLALGLGITSRLPVESSSSRGLGGGWGVLRARLSEGKSRFDVYSARLEPGEGPASPRRLAQLFRLTEFVRAESSTCPYVLLGDLGVASDEREPELLLDLLEARDLCVSHGDEVCGRTLGERRVDYALIPYSSRPPREYARTTFTDMFTDDEQPGVAHFGLRASLDGRFPSLRPASAPPGRDEALAAIETSLENARQDVERRVVEAGWVPFLGAYRAAAAADELAGLTALEEEVRSARLRGVKREIPATPE
ncbi:MAG: endonuclease/exonuclease/phosphatase family protein [Elusimicrobiota bacterium]